MEEEKKKGFMSLDDVKADADPDVEIQALRKTNQGLRQEIQRMQREYGNLKGYFTEVDIAINEAKLAPKEKPLVVKPTAYAEGLKVSSPCVAVLHLSDWHYGQVTDPDDIDYINEFSPEILERRITMLSSNFVKWIDVKRTAYKIDELVILDTGDNISGDIHDELKVTNAFPAPVQAVKVGMFKGQIFTALAQHFKKVRVEFITPDNHSRLTKKPQAGQQGLNSHNYTVGHIAKLMVQNQKNLEFNIYLPPTKTVKVSNRQYLLTHGHGIRGWAGFPYYGIERKVSREALIRLHEPDYNRFHKVILGHFHAPLAHPWYWINGSASGTDALDHMAGRRSKPIQCAWIVHPKWGEFDRTDFQLRDE